VSADGPSTTNDTSTALLIGVGHEQRGDDAVGLLVARQLAGRSPALRVVEHGGDGMDLVFAWEGAQRVVLVDAVVSGECPVGEVHRFEAHDQPLPAALFSATSTHALGVAEAIELARATERLPEHLVVYGIEGASFATGVAPQPRVVEAAACVAARVLDEIAEPADA